MATAAATVAAAFTITTRLSPRNNSTLAKPSRTLKTSLILTSFASLPQTYVGLKHLGISLHLTNRACRGRSRRGGGGGGVAAYASLFGVGAPEALVIGVVALLVFGPKGLAEVARNLGKTLRAFQPTIKELQDVSREFKSTLEREIGLDEVQSTLQNTYRPQPTPVNEKPPSLIDQNGAQPYSSEDLLKVTEKQLASSASATTVQETDPEEKPQATETKSTSEFPASTTTSEGQETKATETAEVVSVNTAPVVDSTSTTTSQSPISSSEKDQ